MSRFFKVRGHTSTEHRGMSPDFSVYQLDGAGTHLNEGFVVRHDHEGRSLLLVKPGYEIADYLARGGVEVARRLVAEDDVG